MRLCLPLWELKLMGAKTNFLDNGARRRSAMKISMFFDEIINILAEIYRL